VEWLTGTVAAGNVKTKSAMAVQDGCSPGAVNRNKTFHVLHRHWYNVCMDTYKFAVVLEVAVEAFDEDDARTVIGDYLNPGPLDDMISITKTTIKHK
jgi:hypothetical protein